MKKIFLTLFIFYSFLQATSSSIEKAYLKGKNIASKIDKKRASIVRVQKCKYFVLLEKSISVNMRNEAYRGCEDEVYKK